MLVLGLSGFSRNAWGQIGYPASSRFSDPGQVFTGGMDFQGSSTTTSNYNALTVITSTGLTFNQMNMTNITGDGVVLNGSSTIALNSSVFTNVNNDVAFISTLSQISGYANVSTGQSSIFTGTTSGGGSIQFTSPNVTAE